MNETSIKNRQKFLVLVIILLIVFAGSLFVGRYPKPWFTSVNTLIKDPLAQEIVLNIRLPRILMSLLTGMVLAAGGTVLQMIFRNPLVDTGFLGVSQGAGFGASLAIVFLGSKAVYIQGFAFLFACLGLAASWWIATRFRYGDWVLRLILAGIAVSAVYSAGTGLVKYLADPLTQLPEITFWLLGGLWGITWVDVFHIFPIVIPCLVLIYLMRWRLNILSMRDETVFSLGISAGRERTVLLICTVAASAVVVSKTGVIGWIGLIIPHISRYYFGSDTRMVIPGALLVGGIFMILSDDIVRTIFSGEIPLGIFTSIMGSMVFLLLMMRKRTSPG